jgi:hypothetical protein
MFLHIRFEQPTPENMEAWRAWFEMISDKQIDEGGFRTGRETSRNGTRDLPWNMESITGYKIIEAESLDAAEKLAQSNPLISSIRIYEMRSTQTPMPPRGYFSPLGKEALPWRGASGWQTTRIR